MDPAKPPVPLGFPGVARMPLLPQQQQQALGRGLEPAGRGGGQSVFTGGLGQGFISPGDAAHMQFGQGAAMLPASVPFMGLARGLPMTPDRLPVGRAREMMLAQPKGGTAAHAPGLPGLEPRPGQGPPCVAATTSSQFDLSSQGSSLLSMFRGMGLEPSRASWERGQPLLGRYLNCTVEVGRGATLEKNLAPSPMGVLGSPGRDEQPQDNTGQGSSFLGRGLSTYTMLGVGRASIPYLGLGRGPAVAPPLPPGPLSPAASTTFLQPTPPLSPSAGNMPSPQQAPGLPAATPPKVPLTMEATGESLHKAGTKGHPLPIGSNSIPITCKNEAVYQYHVTFAPNIESVGMRFSMMREHHTTTGEVIAFDGSILFLPIKMKDVVLLKSERQTDNQEVEIKIHMTKILPPNSDLCIPFYNVVLRRKVVYQQSPEGFQDECAKELVGRIVITRYNNRTYRIDDIDWNKSPKDTFTLADGSTISFADYYRNHYGITIKEMDQPLLLHRPKERSKLMGKQITGELLLVPELSFMTGIPDKMRKDFRAMKDVTMHIKVGSEQHASTIKKLLNNIRDNPETMNELEKWGLHIGDDILITHGRILPMETICLQTASLVPGADMSWSRDLTREASISCIPLTLWAIFYPRRCAEQTEELVSTFQKVGVGMGMRLEKPIRIELRDDRIETYMKSIHSQLTSEPSIQIVVCITADNRDTLYSAIKKLCCIKCPVPSQVINTRTISQPQKLRSISQKILLQMNCKVGGELWTVNIPLKCIMVIGVDVHHDPNKKNQSVMGFVASLNSLLTQWYSRVSFQGPHEEIINGFQVCLLAALQKFYEVNHNLPEKIVVYRDGVSDSQLKVVTAHEVPQILKSFETFPSYKPKLVYIVVQKRISTSLYAIYGDHLGTPPPGTILDHTLTHGEGLTFKLCHMYWNWSGTIRVPSPCKYAHKLAYLCGTHLHSEPAIQLSDRLYFL
ncbi:hypothetical protein NHX12_025604 [Muraenolepis orangiensis]|uniref:Piwi-like protein 2 n=1 Tax=Muraenolepis orangiensis TaxID=630683 RepID=A0A9Q0EHA3_9TELE|nr:hypothetical protein NHX12_025604 [Muraenolepis orangiensis]